MGLWYWIVEEFKALGLRCVAYGPEFWLALAVICWAIAGMIMIGYSIWRDKK